MARIPAGEQFGNVVARPGPVVRADPAAYGAGVGQVLTQAGQIGMAVAGQQLRQEDAERKHEEARARDRSERVASVAAQSRIRNSLRDLGDEVSRQVFAGEIKPDEAEREYDSRSAKAIAQNLNALPPHLAEVIQADAIGPQGDVRNRVVDAKVKFYQQKAQGDMRTVREELERRAASGERAQAVQLYGQLLANMGPQSGLPTDKLVADLQDFRERTAFNEAASLVRGARDDDKSLQGVMERLRGPDYADLSPDKLGQLEQQVLARRQYLETKRQTAIARAEAAAARQERRAEAATRMLQTFLDGGGIPDETYMAGISQAVSGTSLAPVVTSMLKDAGERTSFALLTPQQQEQKIIELRQEAAVKGSSPALQKRLDLFDKLRAESQRQLKEEPLAYGSSRGLIELKPLQFTTLDELVPQLSERVQQAQLVSARTKVPVSPLLASEATRAADLLASLPLPMRRVAIGKLAQSLDPATMSALSAQIGKSDDTLGISMFASKFLPPETADLMLRGQDAVKAGRIKAAGSDAAAGNDHREIARRLAEVPWPTQQARDTATKAAQLAYDGQRDLRGSASVRDAIVKATGGITEWAGSKVTMPPGMEERAFERALQRLDVATVTREAGGAEVMVGGKPMQVDKLVANLATVKLIPAGGPGVYALDSGGQLILRADGKPLRITIGGR